MRVLLFALSLPLVPAALAAPCDGRYDEAQALVDSAIAKYETLYSGGLHDHGLDTVGATLDLYRLWRDLPDIELRTVRMPHYGEPGFGWDWNALPADAIWERGESLLHGEERGEREARVFASWGPDALTSAGPAPDWWLRPDAFDGLRPAQRWVAEVAPTTPVLDWLQVLLAASNTPTALYDHLGSPVDVEAMSAVSSHAWTRHEGSGEIEWAVASALAEPKRTEGVTAWLTALEKEVLACSASPSTYAAWAVVTHGTDALTPDPEDAAEAFRLLHLPRFTREDLLSRRLMRRVARGEVPSDLEWWRALGPVDRPFLMADYVQALSAEGPAALPAPRHAYVARLLNALSDQDLAVYASAREEEAWLLPILLGRAIAAERWEDAEALIPRIVALGEAQAAQVEAAFAVRGPKPVKLARAALMLDAVQRHICGGNTGPDIGLWIYQAAQCRSRDLPTDFAGGAALDRDLEVFFRVPSRWYAFYGMHGMSISRIERAYARGTTLEVKASLPPVVGGPFPISGWLDVGGLDEGSSGSPLMERVASTLVAWAEKLPRQRGNRVSPRLAAASESLAMLVEECRYAQCGQIDGRPAQEAAFWVLQMRMRNTPAAGATPLWWESPPRTMYRVD